MARDYCRRLLLRGLLVLALLAPASAALAKDGDGGGGGGGNSGSGNSGSGDSGSGDSDSGGDDDNDSDNRGRGRGGDDDGGSGGSGGSGGNSGKGRGRDHDDARSARIRGDVLPLAAIIRSARSAVGGRALDASLSRSRGAYQYRVKMLTSDGRYKLVWVNARTGAVIRIKEL